MDVLLETEPDRLVAVLRETVAMDHLPEFYDRAYRAVGEAVAKAGGAVAGPALGWYHGGPSATVDVAAGLPVMGMSTGSIGHGVQVVRIPGGSAVVAVHTGPYDGLPAAWEELERWRAENAGAGRGDFWEEYVTDPAPGGDPERTETRLVLPLA